MRRRLRPDRKGLVRFAYPGRERTVIIVAAVFNTPDSSAPRVVSALSAITWGELAEQDRQFFPRRTSGPGFDCAADSVRRMWNVFGSRALGGNRVPFDSFNEVPRLLPVRSAIRCSDRDSALDHYAR
ncbi:MAG: hypothetical protein IJH84_06570 [Saccharopolyspora sp.]|uniref:hypothetical protein n=1 Tax=Saccharopolyspora sp. TaxID=33915 RepID=UPI0025E3AD03|nr:hypothetical protein [Saccharopolyspora sp.]MBQ6640682.1 hypothetical protein [Saccharopolyspora sp.]